MLADKDDNAPLRQNLYLNERLLCPVVSLIRQRHSKRYKWNALVQSSSAGSVGPIIIGYYAFLEECQ